MNTTTSAIRSSRTLRRAPVLIAVGASVSGLVIATQIAPAPAATATRELDARMTVTKAYPTACGRAEYDVDDNGREIEVNLRGVKRLAGQRVTVRVHGDLVGTLRVDRYGRAHLEREAGVPAMAAGNVIKVRTAAGTLVSRGVLHHEVDTDHDSDD